MIFKKLELKNWVAYKKAQIDFSTDKKKNVTLFRGNNLGGKTSIMRAIRWALYGDTGDVNIYKNPLDLINRDSASAGNYDLSVKLTLKVDGKDIDLIRSFNLKTGVKKPSNNDFEETFSILENGKAIIKDTDKYVQRIFDKEISDFFIFDGEKLQEYQRLCNDAKKSQKLQNTIEKLIRRPYLKAAANDLKVYQKDLRDKIQANSTDTILDMISQKLNEVSDLKNLKNKDLERLENNLLEEEENLKLAKSKRDAFGEKNDKVARLNEIRGSIKVIEPNIESLRENLLELHENSWQKVLGMAASSSKNEAKINLGSYKESNKNNQDSASLIHLMKQSIENDICMLCDEKPLGKEKKESFLLKIDKLEKENPQSTSKLDSDKFIFQIDQYIKNKKLDKLSKVTENLQSEENKLSLLKVEKEEIEVRLGKDKGEIAEAQQAVDSIFEETVILENDIGILKKELQGPDALGNGDYYGPEGIIKAEKDLQNQYNQLLEKQPTSKEKEHLEEVNKLVSVFDNSISDLSNRLKDQVETRAKNVFEKLIPDEFKGYSVKINEKFGLMFLSNDEQMETSAAGNLFVALALIDALKDSTGIKGPMIIDTPLGRVDLDGRKRILEEFPRMSDQCIILVHSGEIEESSNLDDVLSSNVGKYYEIKKISENESTIIAK
jgi:DNA sulfur modification protein DndD